MSSWLRSLGAMLVVLGLAAHMVGWDALLSVPQAILEAIGSDPGTYGLVAAGILLMLVARLIGRRRE